MNLTWLLNKIQSVDWKQFELFALNTLLYVVVILVAARLGYSLLVYLLRRTLVDRKVKHLLDERKANTMFSLIRSLAFYVITFTVIVNVLKRLFNLDTGTLLASASV